MHSIRIFSVSQNSEKQVFEGLQPSSLIKKDLERVCKLENAWMGIRDNVSYVKEWMEVLNYDFLIKIEKKKTGC